MKKLLTLSLAVILSVLLISCSTVADEVIISALADLSDEAYELNLIIYGDGLARAEVAEENGYYKVADDAAYTSAAALKSAMGEVFSPEYIEVINNTAFRGVKVDEGMVGAKFMEKDGQLYVNLSVTENFGEPKMIDTTNAKIRDKNNYVAIVVIPDGEDEIEVTMRNVDGKWLIDSPIF